MFTLSIACLIKLNIGCFTEKLYVLKTDSKNFVRKEIYFQRTNAFFLPIMIGAFRWRWTMTKSS